MMAFGTPVAMVRKARSLFAGRTERMAYTRKNILIVEQNPVLRDRFNSAFLYSGYDVQITDRIAHAIELVSNGHLSARPFDLVVVDISDKKHLGLVGDVQNINNKIPVFTLKDAADKSMVIDLLNQKRAEFIEHFIQAHARA
jgi:DNA-binding NtrC family response regulator